MFIQKQLTLRNILIETAKQSTNKALVSFILQVNFSERLSRRWLLRCPTLSMACKEGEYNEETRIPFRCLMLSQLHTKRHWPHPSIVENRKSHEGVKK